MMNHTGEMKTVKVLLCHDINCCFYTEYSSVQIWSLLFRLKGEHNLFGFPFYGPLFK